MDANNRAKDTSVPSACLACRSKHLKCDGQNPCSRCVTVGSDCIFIASRRGYKGPRRGTAQNPNKRQATSPPDTRSDGSTEPEFLMVNSQVCTPTYVSPHRSNVPSPAYTPDSFFDISTDLLAAQSGMLQNTTGFLDQDGLFASTLRAPSLAQRCMDSFYYHFHGTHPFILPKEFLHQATADAKIEPLLAAMRWVGSLYLDVSRFRASLLENAENLIHSSQRVVDGYLVQAMMLLIIGLDGSDQQAKAKELLAETEGLAIQMDLHTRSFADIHGKGLPVLEESWRRTWWELFVVDAMIAGAHRSTTFALYDIPTDVALPCEERQYLTGHIPHPLTLEDFEDQDFSGEEREFSSFAYRILSARNLGKFMRMPPMFGPEDENIARIEALLTNFRLHLPPSKKYAIQKDGKIDEMMFQALMMTNATSLILHQPYSQLDSSPTKSIDACAPHQVVLSWDVFNDHTKHTITSANEISKMITYRAPLTSHTHFFACIITLSSIVHLNKWAIYFVPQDDDELRQQIRLNTGALNEISTVWRSAERTKGQIKNVAQEIYRMKKQQQGNSQYWLGFTQEQILNSIATDDSIINDIEKMQRLPSGLMIPSMTGMAEQR